MSWRSRSRAKWRRHSSSRISPSGCRDQRYLNPLLALGAGFALAGFLYCPLPLLPWLGPLQGIFQGSMLAISMMLVVLRTADAVVASRISAMVQSTGMSTAAITPLLVGLLYSWTGSFNSTASFSSQSGWRPPQSVSAPVAWVR